MINLIPQKNKDRLLIEKNKKITIILSFLFLFFLASLILILFAIGIYINGQVKLDKKLLVHSQRELYESEIQEFQEKIKSADLLFKDMSIFYNRNVHPSSVLKKISDIFPENFYLTNFSMKLDIKEEKSKPVERNIIITLSGVSPLREDLISFKESLEKEKSFKDISFPASNWVNKENINFYITFKLAL